jgi:nitrogen PTS system EIIA component
MDLENICPIADTVIDLRIDDKRGVLRDLARRAALTINVDDSVIFNALLKREELGSTGVGNGVAIPHVRLEQVKKPFGVMARLRHPIHFNAVDGQAVDLVCLVLLSKENDGRSSTRWLAWPGDFGCRTSLMTYAARRIEWCSITP